MDVFFVGSLLATVLVMVAALVDEFAPRARTQPELPAAPIPGYLRAPSRQFEEPLPYDEAA